MSHRTLAPASRPFAAHNPPNPNPPSESLVSVPKLRKASAACTHCKRQKARCQIADGATACERCTKRELSCAFELDDDMRRKLAHKRKIESLEEERDVLLQLVQTLQDSPDAKATQLLNLIRSKAPLDEIKLYMDHNVSERDRETTPLLAEIHERTHGPKEDNKRTASHQALNIQRLIDIPVYRVPAAPWTTVTKDDELVSHLISLWLTWSHPFYNWIDKELFLRDARAGKLDSKFCSPFLVNCILAEACFHSDYPDAYADPNDPDSKGVHFYKEARRLYEKIEGRLDLPTIQGCGVLFICMAVMGKDRVGWLYLGHLRSMADEYTKKHPPPPAGMSPFRESRAIDNTIWGIYNLTATASISLMKHLAIDRPNRPLLPCDHPADDTWTPYPRQMDPVQSHIPCVLNSFCALSEINVDANRKVFASGHKPPRDELEQTLQDVQTRLDDWKTKLPPCLARENLSVPQSLSLHMLYHTVVIMLWALLKKEEPDPSTETGHISRETARRTCVTAALAIVDLLRTHRATWGPDYISPTTIHWVSMALFTLVEELDHGVDHRTAFTELCVIARTFARKWTLMKGILRMLQVSAQKNAVALPPETHALFVDFEERMWGPAQREQFRSLYPNPSSLAETGGDRTREEAELDSFLEKWDTLEIREGGEGGEERGS
ncbi:hypothetical protein ASPACDRAFT_36771 [Aspergillus aculeatus ATCC 16872]|uniref:Zn(2)-C6 fungal-type domain-containing protein n=1 Tax=Aspergillus aculeatus (strain ATCC 16872 / CBS 172.66 / WB 5094) TaxID=690307 RepID=A0A1L9WGL1_ASPA1|nr:uncharacterized protein ASPACDRAFT_36771 [Aspergillus aculeatus ATCC 16872]OJJ95245.1 hypothetical protein ASPACDRAFT_36771 [Aspergillus aculeatus ATCC 16872]